MVMSHDDQVRLVEAALFASAVPLSARALQALLPEGCDLDRILQDLRHLYDGRGVVLQYIAEGYAFRTAPDLTSHLTIDRQVFKKPGRAALETLAIIAYHQPVTRAEIEEIRGVSTSRGTLDILIEAGWVKPGGRRKSPGRPLTWVTTPGFLDQFGLTSLEALPDLDDLKASGLLDPKPEGQAAPSGDPNSGN